MQNIKQLLSLPTPPENEITVNGWIKSARHSKGLSFIALSDGSVFADLQIVIDAQLAEYATLVEKLKTGCAITASGKLVASQGKGQKYELQASNIILVGDCSDDYPLQKKKHSFEFLREIAHLRLRTNTFGAVMRVRNVCARAIHDFFQQRGFVWLHSPIITASDCEGAGEMFHVTTLDLEKLPRTPENKIDYARDFFGRAAHLTVSGQLEGEIGALALKNIYTFGPTFRAENSNTTRHLSEFWMVEPEMAFCNLSGDMEIAEQFLKHIFQTVQNELADDLEFFIKMIEPEIAQTFATIIDKPFAHLTYTDAIDVLNKATEKFQFPVHWGMDLQSEHERYLTEKHCLSPVIVTDYPRDIKAFYMYQNDDGKTVRALDILVPRIGEIIGGSQREDRYDLLKSRLVEMKLDPQDYWWYLDLRRYGSVPHAGFGLGFERLVQVITGMKNIRDVIPFPRTPGSADF